MKPAPCPTCRKPTEQGPENPTRPFCGMRCKLVDLGRWFDGAFVVPGESAVDFDAVDLREAMGDGHAGSNDDGA